MAHVIHFRGHKLILHEDIAVTPLGVVKGKPRRIEELLPVMMKPSRSEGIAYWMYRKAIPAEIGGVRGDVTLVYPGELPSGELIKTHGHYHPESPWGERWPELYGILRGKALFVLQDLKGERVRLVEVEEGDLIMVPPGYGHVMVNVGEEELVTFNYVSELFSSEYGPYKERRGAAVYVVRKGEEIEVVPNPRYEVKEVLLCKPMGIHLKEPTISHSFKPHLTEWLKCEEVKVPLSL
ncbi:glucose-6-phosphate isomerase [Ignicoccus islandicus DSM 13165]|uniref:glucose-6-phosphate isomerase n=1 Tax=Ignicoccus islandicus DSM 13165 TaxID=940295 RepID=A0A0U3E8B4_9CREN|nr:glucose-6-phosphate isomerase family protein [Ignicoccus islandicus]ALU11582.1 glucose-6-phosphate isomerase [Ignicoccus islandicus DSM 13165]